ncbi:MAG: hypothetical protein D6723_16805 [Acidobacteria bacterium]|nr:MAG: hypothetical protein D6723_16805 [Acidobacteriota bacterium]
MSKILVLQHVWCETLGTIAEALAAAELVAEVVRLDEGQPVPDDLAGMAGLIVMGGPMSVYDHRRYAFLSDELRLMERALAEDKPILGVAWAVNCWPPLWARRSPGAIGKRSGGIPSP